MSVVESFFRGARLAGGGGTHIIRALRAQRGLLGTTSMTAGQLALADWTLGAKAGTLKYLVAAIGEDALIRILTGEISPGDGHAYAIAMQTMGTVRPEDFARPVRASKFARAANPSALASAAGPCRPSEGPAATRSDARDGNPASRPVRGASTAGDAVISPSSASPAEPVRVWIDGEDGPAPAALIEIGAGMLRVCRAQAREIAEKLLALEARLA